MSLKALKEVSENTFNTAGRSVDKIRSKDIERVHLRVPVVRKLAKTGR